jgi:hypothetical protein
MRSHLYKNLIVLLTGTILCLPVTLSKVSFAKTPVSTKALITAQTATQTYRSGIEGIVIISPISPVEQIGVPNFRPYQATISVLNTAGETVTQFQSREDGLFRVELKPGIYILRPESESIYPRAEEQTVTVSKNKFTRVLISYDSGIR